MGVNSKGVHCAVMRALIALLTVSLAGCFSEPSKPSAGVRAERKAAAAAEVAKTPIPRVYRYTDGELRILDVPTASKNGFLESNRCFIWRDMELKTASLSCPGPADYLSSGLEHPSPKD